MIASRTATAGEIRDHWVCHFQFWDRPLTGLVDLDGQHWWAELTGGVYRLTQVELTPECREFLADYSAAYHHCFYLFGTRPRYDGRPLNAFSDKWGQRNPIRELAEQSEAGHARG